MTLFPRAAAVAAVTLLFAGPAPAQYGAFGGHSWGGSNPYGPPGFNPLPPGFGSSPYRPGGFHPTPDLYGLPGVGPSHPITLPGHPGVCIPSTGNPHVDAMLQGHGVGVRPGFPTGPVPHKTASDPMRYTPSASRASPTQFASPALPPRVEMPRPVVAPVVTPTPTRAAAADGDEIDASFVAAVAVAALGACIHLATARK